MRIGFIGVGNIGAPIAGQLLAAGHALVGPNVLSACAAENWSAERAARRAKLGLWSDPYYEIMSADRAEAVAARRGHFTLVEGKVVSVRESGATIYVNFGRRRSGDITVTVLIRRSLENIAFYATDRFS